MGPLYLYQKALCSYMLRHARKLFDRHGRTPLSLRRESHAGAAKGGVDAEKAWNTVCPPPFTDGFPPPGLQRLSSMVPTQAPQAIENGPVRQIDSQIALMSRCIVSLLL
jgi:hypothetical protein